MPSPFTGDPVHIRLKTLVRPAKHAIARPMTPAHVLCASSAIGCVVFLLALPAIARGTPLRPGRAHTSSSLQPAPTCANEVLGPDPAGGQWTCSFDDEFDSTTGDPSSLNGSWWTPQLTATSGYTTGSNSAAACYVDSPNNISVSGGALHLTVRKEAAPLQCGSLTTQYTSGMVSTASRFVQTYGRFEVRALLPQTLLPGLQETIWLYPQNLTYGPWPASGELDFAEFYSLYSVLAIPYVHYNHDSSLTDLLSNTNRTTADCAINPVQYNDYAVTWQPGSFTITINGHTCLTDNYQANGGVPANAPFDQPFFIVFTQALGAGLNAYDPLLTPLPATMSIDYVRVWTGTAPDSSPTSSGGSAGAGSGGSGSGSSGSGGSGAGGSGTGSRSGSGSTPSKRSPASRQRLTITDVKESVSRWQAAHGTTFHFMLNRASTVKLLFREIIHGHRLNGRCTTPSRPGGNGPGCQLNALAGQLAVTGHAGLNTIPFHARLSDGHLLAPGTYTVTITAAGASSKPLQFTITTA
jgi:beta-glucanase (GH16 family)